LKKRHPESQWLIRIYRKHLDRGAANGRPAYKEGFHKSKVLNPVISTRMK
jgi:hypothetical protein